MIYRYCKKVLWSWSLLVAVIVVVVDVDAVLLAVPQHEFAQSFRHLNNNSKKMN